MTNLNIKDRCQDFSLASLDDIDASLTELLTRFSRVYLVFFKVTCPTCIFTLPYIDKMFGYYPGTPILAISQDDASRSIMFKNDLGLALNILVDEKLTVSKSFQLTNVPTLFEIGQNMEIENIIVGFSKPDYEKINQYLSVKHQLNELKLFDDTVPVYKPG